MYYGLVVFAALLFSAQFLFNNGFQKENGTGWNQTIKLSFYTSLIGLIITLVINKFEFHYSLFSLAVAVVYGVVCIGLNFCTIKAFEYASLSVYTVFSMIGGMALPFIYGVISGEELNAVRIVCFVLITLSIILMIPKGDKITKALPCYIGVFILNGSVGVISKIHQSYAEYCVDSASFLMLTKVVMLVICLVIVVLKTRDLKINAKSVAYSTGIAGFNSIANLMLLIALLNLPVSVQYPMVTGGTIVFSAVIDLIRKEKVTKKELVAAAVAFVSSCLMAV